MENRAGVSHSIAPLRAKITAFIVVCLFPLALCACRSSEAIATVPTSPGDPKVYQQLSTQTDCTLLLGSKMFFESLVGSDSGAKGYIDYAEKRIDEQSC